MKLKNIILPKIVDYYISPNNIEFLNNYLKDQEFVIKERNNSNYISLFMDYNSDILGILRTIIDKTERVTVGDMYKYQYELDMGSGCDYHIFEMSNSEGYNFKCILTSSFIDNKNKMIEAVFKIID